MTRPADVSVIIPTYNCGKYVARAVESALRQTVPVREVIVVDDGSTDGTDQQLAPYLDRITYVRQENQGAAAARNRGVAIAGGGWVAFLDADDAWLPEKIERQLDLASRYPEAIAVYCQLQNIDPRGERNEIYPATVCASPSDVRLIPSWVCLHLLPGTPTMIVRTDAILAAGGFLTTLATVEDYDLWVRLLACGSLIGVEEVLVHRYLRDGSLTHTHPPMVQYRRVLDVVRRRHQEIRVWGGAHAGAGACHAHTLIAKEHLRASRRWRALGHAVCAMRRAHPSRTLAAKILLECLLGAGVYSAGARLARSGSGIRG